MLIKSFPICIEKANENTAFGVIFPNAERRFSAGDTIDAAIINAKEALIGFVELAQHEGDPIPEPHTVNAHINSAEFSGFIWSYIEIDIGPYSGKSKKVNVTLPEYTIKKS